CPRHTASSRPFMAFPPPVRAPTQPALKFHVNATALQCPAGRASPESEHPHWNRSWKARSQSVYAGTWFCCPARLSRSDRKRIVLRIPPEKSRCPGNRLPIRQSPPPDQTGRMAVWLSRSCSGSPLTWPNKKPAHKRRAPYSDIFV